MLALQACPLSLCSPPFPPCSHGMHMRRPTNRHSTSHHQLQQLSLTYCKHRLLSSDPWVQNVFCCRNVQSPRFFKSECVHLERGPKLLSPNPTFLFPPSFFLSPPPPPSLPPSPSLAVSLSQGLPLSDCITHSHVRSGTRASKHAHTLSPPPFLPPILSLHRFSRRTRHMHIHACVHVCMLLCVG